MKSIHTTFTLFAGIVMTMSPVRGQNFVDDITIDNASPDIELNDTDSGETDWEICVDNGCGLAGAVNEGFHIAWDDGFPFVGLPFIIESRIDSNLLYLDSADRIGINTSIPGGTLQINSSLPEIILEDTSADDQGWIVDGDNDFSIRSSGLVVPSISIRDDDFAGGDAGYVGILKTAPLEALHVGDNVRIDGDIAIASSRTLKTAFESVDTGEVLARVADLPLASWHYASDDETDRHIGPFAEDFQRLFGVGDGETISVIDAQGVTFAAIQELERRLAEKNAELTQLRREKHAEIAGLEARLLAVEERMARCGPGGCT